MRGRIHNNLLFPLLFLFKDSPLRTKVENVPQKSPPVGR